MQPRPSRYPSSNSSWLNLHRLVHPDPRSHRAITAYGASKLCNLLLMLELHQRYSELGVSCNAVHPGNLLPTGLMRRAGCLYRSATCAARLFTKSVVSRPGQSLEVFEGRGLD